MEFAVVVIKESVGRSGDRALQEMAASLGPHLGNVPVVLMWQDRQGTPTYWGRPDIARLLSGLDISQLPSKTYTLAV